ncbi:hypothetical protein ABMA27_003346 [Loxostege sticticalis]|uniref:Nuclease HARBI1 n=1 Tax=Loxostege sticticalis TaxID=481309 RepID=A0ABR3HSU4_LOXSC
MDFDDIENLETHRCSVRHRNRLNSFDMDDEDFRFTKRFGLKIVDLLREDLAYDPRGHALSPELQLACALRNWARHELNDTGDLHGVSQPVISKTCKKIAGILACMSPRFIKMAATLDEQEEAIRRFRRIANFPRVIADGGQLYINRKGFSSINVQVVIVKIFKLLYY